MKNFKLLTAHNLLTILMGCSLLTTTSVFSWNPWSMFKSRSCQENLEFCKNPQNCDLGGYRESDDPNAPVEAKASDRTKRYIGSNDARLKQVYQGHLIAGLWCGALSCLGAAVVFLAPRSTDTNQKSNNQVIESSVGATTVYAGYTAISLLANARKVRNLRTSLQSKQAQTDIPYDELSATKFGADNHTINSREYFWQVFPRSRNKGKMQ